MKAKGRKAVGRQRRTSEPAVRVKPEAPDLKLVAQLAVRVPGELALRLRRFCQETSQNFNQTVAEALEKYLAQQNR